MKEAEELKRVEQDAAHSVEERELSEETKLEELVVDARDFLWKHLPPDTTLGQAENCRCALLVWLNGPRAK